MSSDLAAWSQGSGLACAATLEEFGRFGHLVPAFTYCQSGNEANELPVDELQRAMNNSLLMLLELEVQDHHFLK